MKYEKNICFSTVLKKVYKELFHNITFYKMYILILKFFVESFCHSVTEAWHLRTLEGASRPVRVGNGWEDEAFQNYLW